MWARVWGRCCIPGSVYDGIAKKSRQGLRKGFSVRGNIEGIVGAERVGAVVESLDGATLK